MRLSANEVDTWGLLGRLRESVIGSFDRPYRFLIETGSRGFYFGDLCGFSAQERRHLGTENARLVRYLTKPDR